MKQSYFIRVTTQTPTEFWINNPTRDQADLSISNGATGCTNNPAYAQKMVDHPSEGAYALKVMDETIQEIEREEDVLPEFQRRLVKPICEKFQPIYEHSGGRKGFVSIQGD